MERTCIVTGPQLEHQLALVRAATKDPRAGLFGPGSVSWRIDREAAIFLGSGPALLLQLAHPWVAAAIVQHSRALDDPIGRFHRTFGIIHAMVFGSLDQALAAARQLHRRHAAVRGRMHESVGPFAAGSECRADDVAALRWVHATLVDTALRVYEGAFGPLAPLIANATGPRAGCSRHCSASPASSCRQPGTGSRPTWPRCTAPRCWP